MKAVGEAIQSALSEEQEGRTRVAQVRSRLLDAVTSGRWPLVSARSETGMRWPLWSLRIGVPIAAFAVTAAVFFWLQKPAALTFEIGEGRLRGQAMDLVEAPGSSPVALRFSEGSVMDLQPLARARVLSSSAEGARVLLERGEAEVSVVHQAGQPTRWAFEAGPFSVAVTGTRFRLAWKPGTQQMALAMSEGSVRVSGPCLAVPRDVAKGEQLELSCAPGFALVENASQQPSDAPEAQSLALDTQTAEAKVDLAADAAPSAQLAGARQQGAPSGTAADSWQHRLDVRDWPGAVHAAEREDFATVCRRASRSELDRLANAARLEGRTEQAIHALSALRQRFPGSNEAATAAFTLGRMAFDQRHDYNAAITWFSSYLRERPSGPLMGDAVGRVMEARHKAGDRAGASADAKRYLARFPQGPYARAASEILAL